jgi:stress response protein SCP2
MDYELKDEYGGSAGTLGSLSIRIVYQSNCVPYNHKKSIPLNFEAERAAALAKDPRDIRESKENDLERARAVEQEQSRLAEEAAAKQRALEMELAQAAALQAEEAKRAQRDDERAAAAQALQDKMEAKRLHDERSAALKAAAAAKLAAEAEQRRQDQQRQEEYDAVMHPGVDFKVPVGVRTLTFGLSWDSADYDERSASWQPVDLDATCMVFDANGCHIDTSYFNQLSAAGGAVIHSGDSKDGAAEGDDEVITVHLDKLAQSMTLVFTIGSYDCVPLNHVDTTEISMYCDGNLVGTIDLSSHSSNANALLASRLHFQEGRWVIKQFGQYAAVKAIDQILPFVYSNNVDLWRAPSQSADHKLILVKDASVVLDDCKELKLGLGWSFYGASVDLDASVATLDACGNTLEKIYYGNKTSEDHTIRHLGDNRSGKGDGDDEVIIINLHALSPAVGGFGVCVTSYKQTPFSSVEEAHMRVVQDGVEIARYSLHDLGPFTGTVLVIFFRQGQKWRLSPVGISGFGKSVSYCTPSMEELFVHKSSHGRKELPEIQAFQKKGYRPAKKTHQRT